MDTGLIGAQDHKISTVQSITKQHFTGTADVKISPGFARLRSPENMLPTFNSVENNGWLDINELKMNERQITGEVSFNMFNKPDITINRLTGEITISVREQIFRVNARQSTAMLSQNSNAGLA